MKLNDYVLKGTVLKATSIAIADYIDGTLNGYAAEVLEDDAAIVYRFSRDEGRIFAQPTMEVRDNEVTRVKGKKIEVEAVFPEGKSRGLYVSQAENILVPLIT